MKPVAVALVARADKSRKEIARYLRDASCDVTECDELSIVTKFAGIVVVDDDTAGEELRSKVRAWLERPHPPRVVVISSRPAAWKTLSLTLADHLNVLAAPSFGWEIVDALRANPPELPGPA